MDISRRDDEDVPPRSTTRRSRINLAPAPLMWLPHSRGLLPMPRVNRYFNLESPEREIRVVCEQRRQLNRLQITVPWRGLTVYVVVGWIYYVRGHVNLPWKELLLWSWFIINRKWKVVIDEAVMCSRTLLTTPTYFIRNFMYRDLKHSNVIEKLWFRISFMFWHFQILLGIKWVFKCLSMIVWLI